PAVLALSETAPGAAPWGAPAPEYLTTPLPLARCAPATVCALHVSGTLFTPQNRAWLAPGARAFARAAARVLADRPVAALPVPFLGLSSPWPGPSRPGRSPDESGRGTPSAGAHRAGCFPRLCPVTPVRTFSPVAHRHRGWKAWRRP